MPQCPQCKKDFVELPRKCTACMADLDLLVEYVGQLQSGLEHAERLTRAGELGQAMWAYLSVLEVDPDNPIARRQVGQVATAVRQFDRTIPGRRWLFQIRGEKIPEERSHSWLRWVLVIVLVLFLALVSFSAGYIAANLGSGESGDSLPSPGPAGTPMRLGN